MKMFMVDQGEGVIGPYGKIAVATSGLYSCMGVVMVNGKTGRAGLYHYPSESMNNFEVQATLIQMITDLSPDQVVITPARTTENGQGSPQSDRVALQKYIKGQSRAAVTIGEERSISNFWSKDGTLYLNEMPPDSISFDREGMDQHAKEFDFCPRKMTADTWYYGANKEGK